MLKFEENAEAQTASLHLRLAFAHVFARKYEYFFTKF